MVSTIFQFMLLIQDFNSYVILLFQKLLQWKIVFELKLPDQETNKWRKNLSDYNGTQTYNHLVC